MATAKKTMYPFAVLDKEGQFSHIGLFTWKRDPEIDSGSGDITIPLDSFEVELECPEDLRQKALEVLRAHRSKLQAEHVNLMTQLQFTENNLLGLAAPEILDAGVGPAGKPVESEDDDIPF